MNADEKSKSNVGAVPLCPPIKIGYGAMVLDLDGDGRDEVLIYDRRKILVYGAPA